MSEFEEQAVGRPPRTIVVLALLAGVALVFSWLAAYAVSDALVHADILAAWPSDRDPRPRWLVESFVGLLSGLVLIASIFRIVSGRQLRRIDQSSEEP
jgi:hypothetical protein